MSDEYGPRFLIIGGGPAGTSAATTAAALGAKVTLVEDSVVGGAAHLWDCIPAKTMVASSIRMQAIIGARNLGIVPGEARVDLAALAERVRRISADLSLKRVALLESQDVEIVRGRGRFTGPHTAVAETADGAREFEFDLALVSTGSKLTSSPASAPGCRCWSAASRCCLIGTPRWQQCSRRTSWSAAWPC